MNKPTDNHPIPPFAEGPSGALLAVLGESRRLGFLGPGPVQPHVDRALAMLTAISGSSWGLGAGRCMDLGSGGGIPGLVLGLATPDLEWVLLDGSVTRTTFLRYAVDELSLTDRVSVVTQRAEEAGRDAKLRAGFSLVVARSFGSPAVTAECAAPFLEAGGHLVVSEPPEGSETRWPAAGLEVLGMRPAESVAGDTRLQVIEQVSRCDQRFPRRVGIPAKRPIF